MTPVIRIDCPCPKQTCPNHTLCDKCEAEQKRKGGVPFCKRSLEVSLQARIPLLPGFQK